MGRARMKKKETKPRATNPHTAAVLAKIASYQERPVPLLDEMTAEEQAIYYDQILVWLSQARPRTTSYLTRRARAQISGELDVEMADDIWWFRFFEANFTHLLALVQQKQAVQEPQTQE